MDHLFSSSHFPLSFPFTLSYSSSSSIISPCSEKLALVILLSSFFSVFFLLSHDLAAAFQVPMLCGVVTDEGMLLGYFLKEQLDKLSVPDIR